MMLVATAVFLIDPIDSIGQGCLYVFLIDPIDSIGQGCLYVFLIDPIDSTGQGCLSDGMPLGIQMVCL